MTSEVTQAEITAFRRGWDPDEDDQHIRNGLTAFLDAANREVPNASPAEVRAALDQLLTLALPLSGGQVRKRLKQLRTALAELDDQRLAATGRHAGEKTGDDA